MENPCKIVALGDSILNDAISTFEISIKESYPDHKIDVINSCIVGGTTNDGIKAAKKVKKLDPTVVIISYGMNDQRKGVCPKTFKRNLNEIITELSDSRLVLVTITPDIRGFKNKKINEYNDIIRDVAREHRIKVADIASYWKKKIYPPQLGLGDKIHPSKIGRKFLVELLTMVVPRSHTVILWEYNGSEAKCNYRCPYCYYAFYPKAENFYFGEIDHWKKMFLRCFGKQDLIFYIAFGEPTLGEAFYDVVEMVQSVKNWQLRMTTNLSLDLDRLLETELAKEKRVHINASFHPLSTDIESFIERLNKLREGGIEPSVIYVMYPPFFKKFHSHFERFRKDNYVVHVRRFRGLYKGKFYPHAYTDGEKRFIAKYSDDGTIKYMLNNKPLKTRLSFSGYDFFIVDCTGNVGMDSDVFHWYTEYKTYFGNVLQYEHFRFPTHLQELPYFVFEGTVDGVSNLVDADYKQLQKNNVLDFAAQGGVTEDKYKHLDTDFTDSKIRAEYYFFPRNIKDLFYRIYYAFKRKEVIAYIKLFVIYFKLVKNKIVDLDALKKKK